MTAYAASFTTSVSPASGILTITPGATYQVRVARIEVSAPGVTIAGAPTVIAMKVYPSSTPTGGTTLTPLPMRGGAPASTATVKSGASISGTNVVLHQEGATDSGGVGSSRDINTTYSSPFDLILSSGSALSLSFDSPYGSGWTWTLVVYFEELRLAWSG